eukprot:TRINITY_DN30601_c0_g1_i1.p2 TRINITY_DN30601_c0_g1~~TRINITY_DN30601_c0_g1_i1.p2  ORF type:complete len:105 (-),score=20.61 TRINITY_DN30601_c0_g1_i1:146-460(-)
MAQMLAWDRVLGGVGEAEWTKCAQRCKETGIVAALFVAGIQSACNEGSLQEMRLISGPAVELVRFPNAGHSIHNANKQSVDEFDRHVERVMKAAAKSAKKNSTL